MTRVQLCCGASHSLAHAYINATTLLCIKIRCVELDLLERLNSSNPSITLHYSFLQNP